MVTPATRAAQANAAKLKAAIANELAADIRRVYGYRLNIVAMNGIRNAAAAGTRGSVDGVRAIASGFGQNMNNPKDMLDVHTKVANMAKESVRRSFSRSMTSTAGHYRVGGRGDKNPVTRGGFLTRYSGGSLRRAIFAESLARPTPEGIQYVDEDRLTKEAAHWARINFGTKPYERQRSKYRMVFDGRVVDTLGFNVGSRAGFFVPPSYWKSPESGKRVAAGANPPGTDQLFLARGKKNKDGAQGSLFTRRGSTVNTFKRDAQGVLQVASSRPERTGLDRKPSRGIKPHEFLDAGLRTMAIELPLAYQGLLDSWYSDAVKNAKLPPRVVVRPGVHALTPFKVKRVSPKG